MSSNLDGVVISFLIVRLVVLDDSSVSLVGGEGNFLAFSAS